MKARIKLSVLILTLIFIYGKSAASGAYQGYREVAAKLQSYFNEEKFDSIYSLCDDIVKKAITQQKFSAFFKDMHDKNGKMLVMDSVNFVYPATKVVRVRYANNTLLDMNLTLNAANMIIGIYFLPPKDVKTGEGDPAVNNKTPVYLPFNPREKWYVFWGGTTEAQNYHNGTPQQKYAFDFLIKDENGRSFVGDGKQNIDYFAYGKQIFAAADGEVVEVVDGVTENAPGETNPFNATGNTIVIKVGEGEYLTYAHFKTYTIKVKAGEKVKKGQLLGLCGNSGNSTEPHLHFQMQNTAMMSQGTGIKIRFAKIMLYDNKGPQIMQDYSPVKGEKVSAVAE